MSEESTSTLSEAKKGAEKPKLKDFSLQDRETSKKIDLDAMSQEELLMLHSNVEARLQGVRLQDVNLVRETLIQLQKAKALQGKAAETENNVPMNQRAQVQNSIASILSNLARIQIELHDSESIKRIKAALVRVLRTLPAEKQNEFFDLLDQETQKVLAEVDA